MSSWDHRLFKELAQLFLPEVLVQYQQVFQRNIGLFTPRQQQLLRKASVLIAGTRRQCQGEARTLARFGIGEIRLLEVPERADEGDVVPDLLGAAQEPFEDVIRDTTPWTNAYRLDMAGGSRAELTAFAGNVNILIDTLGSSQLSLKLELAALARGLKILHICAHPLPMGCVMSIFQPEGVALESVYPLLPDAHQPTPENPAALVLKAGMAATEAALVLTGMRGPDDFSVSSKYPTSSCTHTNQCQLFPHASGLPSVPEGATGRGGKYPAGAEGLLRETTRLSKKFQPSL